VTLFVDEKYGVCWTEDPGERHQGRFERWESDEAALLRLAALGWEPSREWRQVFPGVRGFRSVGLRRIRGA